MDQNLIATIGVFDGVHRGHLALLEELKQLSRQLGLESAVVTFDPTPREVFHPEESVHLISTIEERLERLRSLGISQIIVLPFDSQMSTMTAEEFLRSLRDKYAVSGLLLGYDHRFGCEASNDFLHYQGVGQRLGVDIYRTKSIDMDGLPISSSRIRGLLTSGRLDEANQLLGYNYSLSGRVVGGLRIGRSMGYPTANLKVDSSSKLIPSDGVYAVHVMLEGKRYSGMLYIGKRPTIDNGLSRTIEVNIFDLSADLYTRRLSLELVSFVRPDAKFDSLDALQVQIDQDKKDVCRILGI